eukprot:gene1143-10657_t
MDLSKELEQFLDNFNENKNEKLDILMFSGHKYNDIFDLISKQLLSSHQSELRIFGLKILSLSKRTEEENLKFLNIVFNFSFDEKWTVRESLIDILNIFNNNFSTLILLFLCEDDIDIVRENSKEFIKELKFDIWKELKKFINEDKIDEDIYSKKLEYYLKILRFTLKNKLITNKIEDILESNISIYQKIQNQIKFKIILKDILNSLFTLDSKEFLNFILNNLDTKDILIYFNFVLHSIEDRKERVVEFESFRTIFERKCFGKEYFEFLEILIEFISNENLENEIYFLFLVEHFKYSQQLIFKTSKKLKLPIEDMILKSNILKSNDMIDPIFFLWMLENFKNETLFLSKIKVLLPKCLKIIESYKNDEKHLGFKSLKILFERSNKEDIIWFDELLIKILHDNMVYRELNIIEFSLPCVVQLLKILQDEKYYELFLKDFFNSLQYLNKNDQRIIYLKNLNQIFSSVEFSKYYYLKNI